jgi:hypothetical protein
MQTRPGHRRLQRLGDPGVILATVEARVHYAARECHIHVLGIVWAHMADHRMLMNLTAITDQGLLRLYVNVLETLREREMVRSKNNPVADFAEGLCAKALKLKLAAKSTAGYDGIDADGHGIEVKARVSPENISRQLSAIRSIDSQHFDYLAAILFKADFSVMTGCLIPHAVIKEYGKHNKHSNSHRFLLRDSVWALPGVRDITEELKAAERPA